MDINLLKKLGFSDKSAQIYFALLQLGPSSVRSLAEYCGLNRGTTYDSLKWLQEAGAVSFYKEETKQQFVAESPERLLRLVENQVHELAEAKKEIDRALPELEALYHRGGDRPVARYVGKGELKEILEDVLETCSEDEEKMYRIYSAEGVREYLYEEFPSFSDARVAKGIRVRVIAIGVGGELRGLDERKWMKAENKTPTYILMYPGKTAYVSLNARHEPVGVVIENAGISETQKIIFDALWKTL
jgi:sugar-specific transcriptional regulator TrmB